GDLIVGGFFDQAEDGTELNGIGRWDGTQWHAFGAGLSGTSNTAVRDFLILDGDLLVGGSFEAVDGVPADRIARWNGSRWLPFDGQSTFGQSFLEALAFFDGQVVAGGIASPVDTNPLAFIAGFDFGRPAVIEPPQNVQVSEGQNATFSVEVANGSDDLTYQWRRNGTPLTDGGNISGALSDTLTISNVLSEDVGAYDVLVTNACGTTGSTPAALSVQGEGSDPSCPGDLNNDGVVNVFDLLELLSNWGACPD
ncbi:MAG: hypothetical protein EA377_00310, partial [Phycisphaerales bacterium]